MTRCSVWVRNAPQCSSRRQSGRTRHRRDVAAGAPGAECVLGWLCVCLSCAGLLNTNQVRMGDPDGLRQRARLRNPRPAINTKRDGVGHRNPGTFTLGFTAAGRGGLLAELPGTDPPRARRQLSAASWWWPSGSRLEERGLCTSGRGREQWTPRVPLFRCRCPPSVCMCTSLPGKSPFHLIGYSWI